jgi:predicted methyltransferase
MIRQTLPLAIALLLAACGPGDAGKNETEHAAAGQAQHTAAPTEAVQPTPAGPLDTAIAGDWRAPENSARDGWRHPKETLSFIGVEPGMAVIEIWPGGGGWYAEILAPYLRDGGRYIGVVVDPAKSANEAAKKYYVDTNAQLRAKFETAPQVYDKAVLVEMDPAAPVLGEAGSADTVLTFRNVHNWMMAGYADKMFQAFFEVLKPGGVLGVVEHRAAQAVPAGDRSGYVGEQQVIDMAVAAGFVLEESSEINANPADTKDHPSGVWTLPPNLRVPEGEDKAKFEAIGESDRMTLRFVKPAQPAAAPAEEPAAEDAGSNDA